MKFWFEVFIPYVLLNLGALSEIRTYGPHEGRIIGGLEVDIERFPHQVSIEISYKHACGGSIIHPSVIISAAHCMAHISDKQNVYPSELLVRAGTSTAGKGGTVHFVQSVEISPSYQDVPDSSDIGLVHLLVPIPITSKSKPIRMSAVTPDTGDLAWVTGFGSQDIQKMTSETKEDHLMAVQIPIFEKEMCYAVMYGLGEIVADDMICAGYNVGHRDACKGDSGGPMVVEDRLVGLTAWGVGCGQRGVPGVYTDVAYHLLWILQCSSDLLEGNQCNYTRNSNGRWGLLNTLQVLY